MIAAGGKVAGAARSGMLGGTPNSGVGHAMSMEISGTSALALTATSGTAAFGGTAFSGVVVCGFAVCCFGVCGATVCTDDRLSALACMLAITRKSEALAVAVNAPG